MNSTQQWGHNLLKTVDEGDPDKIAAYFTDDIRLRMGNGDFTHGKSDTRKSFAGVADKYATHHDIQGVWTGTWEEDGRSGDVVSIEVHVTYTLLQQDGQEITVPCNTTLRREGDLIRDYQVFIDLSPVKKASQP